jgi:hypothetical protein
MHSACIGDWCERMPNGTDYEETKIYSLNLLRGSHDLFKVSRHIPGVRFSVTVTVTLAC